MNLIECVKQQFTASIETYTRAMPLLADPIAEASKLLLDCLLQGRKLLCCGSGGSTASAQRFAALLLNRFERERPGLPAVALDASTTALIAISESFDFDEVYSRQVQALGEEGDLLFIAGSDGDAEVLISALAAAHDRGMRVIALTAGSGGQIATRLRTTDLEIRVPSSENSRIEEMQLLIVHCLSDLVDRQLLGEY